MFSNYDLDKGKNKVYINPNFNRPPANNYPMHVNPRFSHLLSNVQPNLNNKHRIHINPNFMKSERTHEIVKVDRSKNDSYIQHETVSNCFNYSHSVEPLKVEKQVHELPVSKSRYCLVRQNANKLLEEPVPHTPKTTFQVNKYKSIPLNDIKKSLDNAENALNQQVVTTKSRIQINSQPTVTKYSSFSTCSKINQYKLVNSNKGHVVKNKIKTRTLIEQHKKILHNQIRLNKLKGNLKKNNIPCPMFRKFGRCLRKEHGRCDFLHDKKHVSLCRKFIKGLCHDKDCLLSHDLTMKKMPACYFYLQGTCTKPDCPYLHVKLNEKVKVCPDFLKGYCERGDKCTQRHTNMQIKKKVKITLVTTSLNSHKKYTKGKKPDSKDVTIKTRVIDTPLTEKNENNPNRYYEESKIEDSTAEICQLIKPMRCKLGTLPSFIQL